MAVTVHYNGTTRLGIGGDSILSPAYSTLEIPGGLVDNLNGQISAALPVSSGTRGIVIAGSRAGTITGNAARLTGSAPLTVINAAVSGNKIADLDAAVATRVTANNLTHLITGVGVNDLVVPPQTDPTTFRASYDSYLTKCLAGTPGLQLVCLSIWCIGEQWASGPLRWNNVGGYDSLIDALNVQIKASCEAHGGTYVDSHAALLLLEQSLNTPEPGVSSALYTLGPGLGLHPTDIGKLAISNAAVTGFVVAA